MIEAEPGVVIALAGRRIDAPDAPIARFPLANVGSVRQRIEALLTERGAVALVASAACGADLIALGAAEQLGIPVRVVLPFPPEQFRVTSVTDRPGDWGTEFDRIVQGAASARSLLILEEAGEGSAAYTAANVAILDQAMALGGRYGVPAAAVIVWDSRSRGDGDLTARFARMAGERGMEVEEISTLGA